MAKKKVQKVQSPQDVDAAFKKQGWDPKDHNPDSKQAKDRRRQRAAFRRPAHVQ